MKTFYIFLIVLLGQSAFSQGFHPPVRNFSPRDYGVAQPPENYSITVDDRGFIYSANVGGVLQYDGFSWEMVKVQTGLPISKVKYVKNNTIAVGGLNLIGLIQPNDKGKLVFSSLIGKLKDSEKEFGEIITIYEVKGAVIFQSEKCLMVYQNGKVKVIAASSSYFRAVSSNDRFFVRERGVGLLEWKNQELKLFSSDSICKDIGFFGLVDYDEDYFLAATYDLGFYLLDKKVGKVLPFSSSFVNDYWPGIFGVEELKDGNFVITTVNYGVVILNDNLELIHAVGKKEGLRTAKINQICIDKFQNIWAATNEGISWMDISSPFHFFDESSGINGNVEAIVSLGGVFYGGTSTGLYALKSFDESNQPWSKIPSFNSAVYSLDQNGKDVLVASGAGLFRGTLNTFWKISEGNYHSVKYIPNQKKIVAVTSDKMEIYGEDYNLIESIDLQNHFTRILNITYETNHKDFTRAWIGLAQGQGVIKLDIYDLAQSKFEIYDEMDGLMKGEIRPVNIGDEVIFMTNNGLQKFIPEEEIMKTLPAEEKNDPSFYRGYFDAFHLRKETDKGVISAMGFGKGRVYVCIDNSLGYFNEEEIFKKQEFRSLNIGRINSLYVEGNDLWILGADGVIRYNSIHTRDIHEKFNVFFRRISLKDESIVSEGFFQLEKGISFEPSSEFLEINYSNNSLSFEFSTDYFNPKEKLRFSYFLEGHEEGWSAWAEGNKFKLNNLHEGEYVLHVKALNQYGVESKEATFNFIILPPWYRTVWAYVLYVLVLILVIFLAVRIASYRLKQSNIRLESTVQERTMEIATKNDELEFQNHQIRHQKQEITDSINYAKRIQEAILPVMHDIKSVFPNSFVLFKPKDIVSGDFYWFAHQDNHSIFVCADCTGHGVPGAFMSMICTDRINHTVLEKKITTPSAMLSEVNQGIKRSLKQEDETSLKTKDGMDAAFCSFDHEKQILKYAGANRPLWLLRPSVNSDTSEIIEYKPTKMAVGGFTTEEQVFEEVEIKIEKGDIVYMSTDGYADQFGGPKGKKLMVKAFKELLTKNSHLSFEEQRILLDKHIEDWRNTKQVDGSEIEQVDDMCVIGIKF